jgi:undecaprenyl diphosphate synthase
VSARSQRGGFPRHVAIVMDGNGRWAEARGLQRLRGHLEGARVVREVTTCCRKLGIPYLTLYAFSTENWARRATEVRGLWALLERFLHEEGATLIQQGIELRAVGDLERLPPAVKARLKQVMDQTRGLTGMRLTLALSYGGRDEIARAFRRMASAIEQGRLHAREIDERQVARYLDTADLPDPDLVIRTGGEHRVSNFLLWQIAYSELFITDLLWPSFSRAALRRALVWYAGRKRRFGR